MSGAILLDADLLGELDERLRAFRASAPGMMEELLDAVGATSASQARQRIQETKADPDGDPWPTWSDAYAARRPAGKSLLFGEGDLDDSIQHLVEGDEAHVGSNLPYAAHQFWGSDGEFAWRNIPSRQALGVGRTDVAELRDVIADVISDWVREAAR